MSTLICVCPILLQYTPHTPPIVLTQHSGQTQIHNQPGEPYFLGKPYGTGHGSQVVRDQNGLSEHKTDR